MFDQQVNLESVIVVELEQEADAAILGVLSKLVLWWN